MSSCYGGCSATAEQPKDVEIMFTRSDLSPIKIVFVGETSTGKTALIQRFVHDKFQHGGTSTIGVSFAARNLVIDDKPVKVQVWDTAGQERFRSILPAYYRGAHGVILVFDVTNMKSFESLREWVAEVRKYVHETKTQFLILGNKIDLGEYNRVVSVTAAERLAKELDIEWAEVSACTGENVGDSILSFITRVAKANI